MRYRFPQDVAECIIEAARSAVSSEFIAEDGMYFFAAIQRAGALSADPEQSGALSLDLEALVRRRVGISPHMRRETISEGEPRHVTKPLSVGVRQEARAGPASVHQALRALQINHWRVKQCGYVPLWGSPAV